MESTAETAPLCLFVPDWRDNLVEEAIRADRMKEANDELLQKDWITPGLADELQAHAPTATDVDPSTGTRDLDAFVAACEKVFPVGRQFASPKQLEQAAKIFLDQWAVSCTNFGKQIRCFYSKPPKRSKPRLKSVAPLRVHQDNRGECDCPFAIRFQPCDFKQREKRPSMFHHVRITSAVYQHTCTLSTVFHRRAMQASGRSLVEVEKLKSLLRMLHLKPNMTTQDLRPHLIAHLPHWQAADSSLCCALRARAQKFLLTHPDVESLTQEDALQMARMKRICAADEVIDTDDPLVSSNLHKLFRAAMQDSSSTWSSIRFLEKMRSEMAGFDFRVKFSDDDSGLPEAILWMTRRMRHDLARFSDVLFLDAQQRQFNKSGWPFISPCMTNDEGKLSQGSECICVEESTSIYQWILETMSEIEPRFSLSGIRFIFGDQKITPRLLRNLGIDGSCVLRGDCWHLLNEVWPKPHNFGPKFFEVKHFLKSMLLSQTKREWDDAFQGARLLLQGHPTLQKKLLDVHGNPKYYAGYYLNDVSEGSLGKMGDAPAEQNHSSIVSHIGGGGTMQISEQIKALLERQAERSRVRSTMDNNLRVRISGYRSTFRGHEEAADNLACKHLSAFAHKRFQEIIVAASSLQAATLLNGDQVVWPASILNHAEAPSRRRFVVPMGGRCPCKNRRVMLFMCEHEFRLEGKFLWERFSPRWLNSFQFQLLVHPLSQFRGNVLPTFDFCLSATAEQPWETLGELDSSQMDLGEDNETVDLQSGTTGAPSQVLGEAPAREVSFRGVLGSLEALAKAVQGDKRQMSNLMAFAKDGLLALRQGQLVEFQVSLQGPRSERPLTHALGSIGAAPNGAAMKRKRSAQEVQRRARSGFAVSQLSQGAADDDNHCARKLKKRSCRLCRGGGHGVQNCPILLQDGGVPLRAKNKQIRIELDNDLSSSNRYECIDLPPDLTPIRRLPSQTLAIIMTGRFVGSRQGFLSDTFIKCKAFAEGGERVMGNEELVVCAEGIGMWISKNASTIVVDMIPRTQSAARVDG